MKNEYRICHDRILPRDLRRPQIHAPGLDAPSRAILVKKKMWANGSTLRIKFMNGSPGQQELVAQFAPQWTQFANLKFEFTEENDAEIRIAFNENDGAWSYVGMDSLDIPLQAATMNLGWQDEGVILHEFGHAIGLGHEHQNPVAGIEWNEATVIRDLAGSPNFWSPEQTRHNVLRKYTLEQINGTAFDRDSIMLYSFPPSWTVTGVGTKANDILSGTDQSFIAGALAYPKPPQEDLVELAIAEPVLHDADIGNPGEEDLYRFQVTESGRHAIETVGPTDIMMKLFGPDSRTALVAEDDDSGKGLNPRIATNLGPGTYYVQIRHYNLSGGTGKYAIRVSR